MARSPGRDAADGCADRRPGTATRREQAGAAFRLARPDRSTVMKAMLLAAGPDERMRPLSSETPTSLLPLGGRTLLDHALDRLRDAGVTTVVVNTHWRGERVAAHLA